MIRKVIVTDSMVVTGEFVLCSVASGADSNRAKVSHGCAPPNRRVSGRMILARPFKAGGCGAPFFAASAAAESGSYSRPPRTHRPVLRAISRRD